LFRTNRRPCCEPTADLVENQQQTLLRTNSRPCLEPIEDLVENRQQILLRTNRRPWELQTNLS
jgi:hypothetical protein